VQSAGATTGITHWLWITATQLELCVVYFVTTATYCCVMPRSAAAEGAIRPQLEGHY
jgi:hypothetical protein